MPRELKIEHAIYLVDDKSRTYRFLKRNPGQQNLSAEENEKSKRDIKGYTRIFRNSQTKEYRYRCSA